MKSIRETVRVLGHLRMINGICTKRTCFVPSRVPCEKQVSGLGRLRSLATNCVTVLMKGLAEADLLTRHFSGYDLLII